MKFNHIRAIAFDLDGTIYYGHKLIDGVKEVLDNLRERNIAVYYFTNNSIKTRRQVWEKLTSMGLSPSIEEVYNSAFATGLFVRQRGYKRCYCFGAEGLELELKACGLEIGDSGVDAIAIGLHHRFDYQGLTKVLNIYKRNLSRLIACNIDGNYPVENGMVMPGCGAIVASVEAVCGKRVDDIVGKPSTFMIEKLAEDWQLKPSEIMVVGDTYESDIAMAKKFRCPSVLIAKNNCCVDKNIPTISDIRDILKYV